MWLPAVTRPNGYLKRDWPLLHFTCLGTVLRTGVRIGGWSAGDVLTGPDSNEPAALQVSAVAVAKSAVMTAGDIVRGGSIGAIGVCVLVRKH